MTLTTKATPLTLRAAIRFFGRRMERWIAQRDVKRVLGLEHAFKGILTFVLLSEGDVQIVHFADLLR